MSLISFKPLYQERVWGGRDLEKQLGRALPPKGVFGESWEIVDRPEAQSVVSEGPHAGQTLRALIEAHTAEVMGPRWDKKRTFPILVKWLDCQERLSLQVHPPAKVAPALKGEPKTECWYIASCRKDSGLIAGLKRGTTRDAFEKAMRANDLEALCHRFPVGAGDHIFIPSGRIHAIDAGNLILEIQQNSDTTYRVYDWGRVGLDGKPRQLHLDESMASIDFADFEPPCVRAASGEQVVADCQEFRTRKLELGVGQTLRLGESEEPRLLGMVTGSLRDESSAQIVRRGDNVIVPYAAGAVLKALEPSVFLLTDRFAR